MALTRSPGVRGETAVNGATPQDMRRALKALLIGATPGVLKDCVVTGTASWQYAVGGGFLTTQRSSTDGFNVFSNDAQLTITQADDGSSLAAPGSNSRIDIIYALHNDIDQGDADSLPVFAVRKGNPAGIPTPPTLPTGAIELARKVVASVDANTAAGAAVSIASKTWSTAADTGWINTGDPESGVSTVRSRYRLLDGEVWYAGSFTGSWPSSSSAYTLIPGTAGIPSGFRPPVTIDAACRLSGGVAAPAVVDSAGRIAFFNATGSTVTAVSMYFSWPLG